MPHANSGDPTVAKLNAVTNRGGTLYEALIKKCAEYWRRVRFVDFDPGVVESVTDIIAINLPLMPSMKQP